MKGSIKANTVDKYLSPIRRQIVDIIDDNSTVIEYGCGNGDLLFQLSAKITTGTGLDMSSALIDYANARVSAEAISNLKFHRKDVLTHSLDGVDFSVASLFYHVIPTSSAVAVLSDQLKGSQTVIVCGFSQPENWKQKLLLWLDQRFSGHYGHFKEYARNGYMEGLLSRVGGISYTEVDTFDPVIKIYVIRGAYSLKED